MRSRRSATVGLTAELSIGCGHLSDAVQGFPAAIAADMFIICSYPPNESMLILAVGRARMAERDAQATGIQTKTARTDRHLSGITA
jgi:hypothetical protein